jgi:rhamnopyranosyl-N-acetylglucosaminyl-diphospho-decaprenol beta-1,3/1,4-galactofuranosyltransferase
LRIVAIVVSFNRLALLTRCVESLRAQTRKPDTILVVDSSTQSEVRAWLDAQPDVTTLYVQNAGSAGGMHHGMKWALAHNMDWLWLFDDDAAAMPDALAQLLSVLARRPDLDVVNSLCVREEDAARPSSGAVIWRKDAQNYLSGVLVETVAEIRARADGDGLVDTIGGQLYQGTLISRRAIENVGVVNIEYFTRGDEVEYGLRLMRAGYHLYVCVHSIATHPSSKTIFVHLFGKTIPLGRMTPLKRYYSIRNSIWIRREYYRGHSFWWYVVRRGGAGMFQELLGERARPLWERLDGCGVVLRGVRDGIQMKI